MLLTKEPHLVREIPELSTGETRREKQELLTSVPETARGTGMEKGVSAWGVASSAEWQCEDG